MNMDNYDINEEQRPIPFGGSSDSMIIEQDAPPSVFSLKGKKEMELLRKLMDEMVSERYEYGMNKTALPNGIDWSEDICFQSIEEFQESKIGIFWEFTAFIDYRLNRLKIDHKNYYLELYNKEESLIRTTFTVAKIDQWFVLFEYAMQNFRGIWIAPSLGEIVRAFVAKEELHDTYLLSLYELRGPLPRHGGEESAIIARKREYPIIENQKVNGRFERPIDINIYHRPYCPTEPDDVEKEITEAGPWDEYPIDSPYSKEGEKQIKKIKALQEKIIKDGWGYGIRYRDSWSTPYNPNNEFELFYKSQSPHQLKKSKSGVCWDFTLYIGSCLAKLHIPFRAFYAELDTGEFGDSHAFIVALVDNFYIYFDWLGLFRTSNLENVFRFMFNGMVGGDYKGTTKIATVYEFTKLKAFYGLTAEEFQEKIRKCPKVFQERVKYNHAKTSAKDYELESISDNRQHAYFSPWTEEAELPFMEGEIPEKFILRDLLYPRIKECLDKPENDKKLRKIISDYMDRNMEKLTTAGPQYLIVFGDSDHEMYYNLLGIKKEEVKGGMNQVIKGTGSSSKFMLLRNNPILALLYYLLSYYTNKNDERGVNNILSIYCLAIYWSIYKKYFKKGVIAPVMNFTIDNLTNKYMIKKNKHIFGTLLESIRGSYEFHKTRIKRANDKDCVDFIQRVHNDQNSMIKNIANEYMDNYRKGAAIATRNDDYDPTKPILDDITNATTVIQTVVDKVLLPIVSNGVDLVFAEASAKITSVSISDLRGYLMKIISQDNLKELEKLIESSLFLYIYVEGRAPTQIKSSQFLAWANGLFKKTNTKDENILRINAILEKWAEESGIYKRYTRPGSRVAYKKSIFFYIIFSIQKYA